jgi:hypothetical protein
LLALQLAIAAYEPVAFAIIDEPTGVDSVHPRRDQ